MSFLDPQPAAPEKEAGWFKKTINGAKAWFRQSVNFGFHWLVLLTAIAVLSLDAWFIGLVALAWTHAAPAVKWYYGVGRDTKRNLGWMLGRFVIFAWTAGAYLWLGFNEGFDMALILLVLFGIVVRLILKRDWTLLGAIIIGVLMGGEYGNGVSIAIALFASALVEYERRKSAYMAKQARMANRLNDLDQSQRPVHGLRPTGGRLTDRLTDPATDVPSEYFRGDGSGQAGVVVTEARTEDPYAGYPAPPAHPPVPGERREEERVPRPAHLPPTGSRRDEETGEHPTRVSRPVGDLRRPRPAEEFPAGTHPVLGEEELRETDPGHTVTFRVPAQDNQQDGPPRRRVAPPEGFIPPQQG